MQIKNKLKIVAAIVIAFLVVFSVGVFRYTDVKTVENSDNGIIVYSGVVNSTSPLQLNKVPLSGESVAVINMKYAYPTENVYLSEMKEYSQYAGTGTNARITIMDNTGFFDVINLGTLWQTTDINSALGNKRTILVDGDYCSFNIEVSSAWTETYYSKNSEWSNFLTSTGYGMHDLNGTAYLEIIIYPITALSTITKTTYNIAPLPMELEQIESQYVIVNVTGWSNQIGENTYSSIYRLLPFQTGTLTLGFVKSE